MIEVEDIWHIAPTVFLCLAEHDLLLARGRDLIRVSGAPDRESLKRSLESGISDAGLSARLGDDRGSELSTRVAALGWRIEGRRDRRYERDGSAAGATLGYLTLFDSDPTAMRDKIVGSHAAIIGVGGIGGSLLEHLVAAGVGTYTLFDPDRVEPENLNRQFLYRHQDIGRWKVEAASAYVEQHLPEARITALRKRVVEPEDLPEDDLPDLLFIAGDTPPDLPLRLWTWCRRHRVRMSEASVGLESGTWGPSLDPSQGHCRHCFERGRRDRLSAGERDLEQAAIAPTEFSFGPSNSAIAAMASHEAIRILGSGPVDWANEFRLDFSVPAISSFAHRECSCRLAAPSSSRLESAQA